MKIDGACHCGYIRVEGEADPEKNTVCGVAANRRNEDDAPYYCFNRRSARLASSS